ncbi:MAG: FAD-binding oxidoreductase [Dehalococcoidales bacterium]|nr:FAD-binding oxidoreductase [Dehalococcoidales bacterium]
MANQSTNFTVQGVREETAQMRLISLNGKKVWSFTPGQVAILGIEGVGESYFAITSAPEDKGSMEFLIRMGGGVSQVLFGVKAGDIVQGKGPLGKGFPVDNYYGRDFLLAAVGSAISPIRSVLRSICYRRSDFGKIALVYGARRPEDFPFLDEIEDWKKSQISVLLTVSRPEGEDWTGQTGYVQTHFKEVLSGLGKPVVMICGMKAMLEQSRDELVRLGVAATDILTNF